MDAPLSRSKYSAPACLLTDDTELIVTPMIHSDLAKDTTLLRLFQKAEVVLFQQRPRVCLPLTCVFTFAFASIFVGGIVVRSSTWSSAVLHPMSRFATVLARVDVCRARVGRAGRAISSLVLGFLTLPFLAFLERVNLHPVIICTRSISR